MSDNEYERPLLVTIIAVLYGLIGVILLLGGIAFIVTGNLINIEQLLQDISPDMVAMVGNILGGVCVVIGLIYLILCLGFLKGWKIMWYLGLIFAIIGLITSLFGLPLSVITLIIEALIIYYLFRPNVKLFFLKHE